MVLWEDKNNKPLARHIKEKKERIQINKIRNEKRHYNGQHRNTQKIIRGYYKQLYANTTDNLQEMNKFLERYNPPRLKQEEIENMNRLITSTKI